MAACKEVLLISDLMSGRKCLSSMISKKMKELGIFTVFSF